MASSVGNPFPLSCQVAPLSVLFEIVVLTPYSVPDDRSSARRRKVAGPVIPVQLSPALSVRNNGPSGWWSSALRISGRSPELVLPANQIRPDRSTGTTELSARPEPPNV